MGTSTTAGALAVVAGGSLAGTSTGLATTTGALAVARALAGTSAGSSTATGAFPVAFTFPTTISGRNVLDQNGNPWIAVGEAAWSLIVQLTNTQQDQYLTDRAAKGYRAIIVNLIEHSFSNHSPAWKDTDGNIPFTGTAFQSTLTPAYWTRVDRVITRCVARHHRVRLARLPRMDRIRGRLGHRSGRRHQRPDDHLRGDVESPLRRLHEHRLDRRRRHRRRLHDAPAPTR